MPIEVREWLSQVYTAVLLCFSDQLSTGLIAEIGITTITINQICDQTVFAQVHSDTALAYCIEACLIPVIHPQVVGIVTKLAASHFLHC